MQDFATTAHDCNNELFVIGCLANILEKKIANQSKDQSDQELLEDLQKIVKKIKKKVKMASLTLKSHLPREKDEISVHENFIKIAKESAEDYNLEFNSYIISSNDEKVDELTINRSLHNIVKNSKEAGATEIDVVETRNFVFVRDNGNGFSQEFLESFNKRDLLLSSLSSKEDSRGFGLKSIIKSLKEYGWEVEIKNHNNGKKSGAEIRIYTSPDKKII